MKIFSGYKVYHQEGFVQGAEAVVGVRCGQQLHQPHPLQTLWHRTQHHICQVNLKLCEG